MSIWEQPGFAAALALLGVVVGALLQPVAQALVRRSESKDRERSDAKETAADMDSILANLILDFTHEAAQEAAEKWGREVQRSVRMMSRFHSDEKVRLVARSLWLETSRCVRKTIRGPMIDEKHAQQRAEVSERRLDDWGEASYALDKLVELLGGPKAQPREGYSLQLKSDSRGDYRQEWEK